MSESESDSVAGSSLRQQLRSSLLQEIHYLANPVYGFDYLLAESLHILSEVLVTRRTFVNSTPSVSRSVSPRNILTAARKDASVFSFEKTGSEEGEPNIDQGDEEPVQNDDMVRDVGDFDRDDVPVVGDDYASADVNEDVFHFDNNNDNDNSQTASMEDVEEEHVQPEVSALDEVQLSTETETNQSTKKKRPRLSLEEMIAKKEEILVQKQQKLAEQQQALQAKMEKKRLELEEKARQKALEKLRAKEAKAQEKALLKEIAAEAKKEARKLAKEAKKQSAAAAAETQPKKRKRVNDDDENKVVGESAAEEDSDMFGFHDESDEAVFANISTSLDDDNDNFVDHDDNASSSSNAKATSKVVIPSPGSSFVSLSTRSLKDAKSSAKPQVIPELVDDVDVVRKKTINGKIYLVSLKSLVYDLDENEVGKLDPVTGEVKFYLKKTSEEDDSSCSESEMEEEEY